MADNLSESNYATLPEDELGQDYAIVPEDELGKKSKPAPDPYTLARRLRHLDGRKESLSMSGTKGFFREVFRQGLPAIAVAAVAGAALGAVSVGVSLLMNGSLPIIGTIAAWTAGAAGITTAVVGTKGALEDIEISRDVNARLDETIAREKEDAKTHGMDIDIADRVSNIATSKPRMELRGRNTPVENAWVNNLAAYTAQDKGIEAPDTRITSANHSVVSMLGDRMEQLGDYAFTR